MGGEARRRVQTSARVHVHKRPTLPSIAYHHTYDSSLTRHVHEEDAEKFGVHHHAGLAVDPHINKFK